NYYCSSYTGGNTWVF
nr:immunoglobulin light chain junction region [Macaca mulatta]